MFHIPQEGGATKEWDRGPSSSADSLSETDFDFVDLLYRLDDRSTVL
jgi:hypothetical protein